MSAPVPIRKRDLNLRTPHQAVNGRWKPMDGVAYETIDAACANGGVWLRLPGCDDPVFYERVPCKPIRDMATHWAPVLLTDGLSRWEMHVFLMLAQGHGTVTIANRVFRSRKTVTELRRRLLDKSGLRSNAEIAVYAHRVGLTHWPFEDRPAVSDE